MVSITNIQLMTVIASDQRSDNKYAKTLVTSR